MNIVVRVHFTKIFTEELLRQTYGGRLPDKYEVLRDFKANAANNPAGLVLAEGVAVFSDVEEF